MYGSAVMQQVMEVAVNARGVNLREVAVGGGTPVVNTIAAGEVEKFE